MPKPPIYLPESLFHAVAVTVPSNCYYCPEPIIAEETPEYILTVQKDKTPLKFHPMCLDQFVWTALHFYADYVRKSVEEPELLN